MLFKRVWVLCFGKIRRERDTDQAALPSKQQLTQIKGIQVRCFFFHAFHFIFQQPFLSQPLLFLHELPDILKDKLTTHFLKTTFARRSFNIVEFVKCYLVTPFRKWIASLSEFSASS